MNIVSLISAYPRAEGTPGRGKGGRLEGGDARLGGQGRNLLPPSPARDGGPLRHCKFINFDSISINSTEFKTYFQWSY